MRRLACLALTAAFCCAAFGCGDTGSSTSSVPVGEQKALSPDEIAKMKGATSVPTKKQ